MNEVKKQTIFLAAGVTGGHIFPAVALAEELTKRGHNPVIITDQRTKKYLGENRSVMVEFIPVKYPYGNLINKINGALSQIRSYYKAKKLIKKYDAACVVGFGGYPSLPTMYAAIARK